MTDTRHEHADAGAIFAACSRWAELNYQWGHAEGRGRQPGETHQVWQRRVAAAREMALLGEEHVRRAIAQALVDEGPQGAAGG
jgi:hypothetical protein